MLRTSADYGLLRTAEHYSYQRGLLHDSNDNLMTTDYYESPAAAPTAVLSTTADYTPLLRITTDY